MLDEILQATHRRIEALPPPEELRARAETAPPVRDFAAALGESGLSVIAEVKRRSPSAGELNQALDPARQAAIYEQGGAAAVSVLTEPSFFAGSGDDLVAVRSQVELPVLRKDFILVPAQVWETRAMGADALLLIVSALSDDELRELLEETEHAGMTALVEVHDAVEVARAFAAGARLVGVNNRDLATFEVDLATSEKLAPLLSPAEVKIAESGINTPEHAARMREAGYDAVLVGEALVRAADPAILIAALVGR